MATPGDVVTAARSWIGTPFHHQGALKGVGCDCIGLIAGVARELGLPEAAAWFSDCRYKGYGPQPEPVRLLAACRDYLDPQPLGALFPGNVLLFAIKRDPMHFGIVSSQTPLRVIHAWKPTGRALEQGIDERWRRRIYGVFRLRGVA